ncbi:MAG: histidinol-phosphate transaminase [Lachnospiraceae bacterium]|nr:histidinol-phosphate transaminase [Lachnospiraceae bacterium]
MREWEKYIRKVTPYTPGEQPNKENMVKLNTNECPYPPTPKVDEIMNKFNTDLMRLYPAPDVGPLVKAIAHYYGVSDKQVFVGVGSDDVLGMAFLTFFNSNKPILFPDITYSFYDVWADLFRIPFKTIPVNDSFEINPEDYNIENGGVIFANPNAPTAVEMPLDGVEQIIKSNQDSIVIVDEAYADFGTVTARDLLPKYDNLLVTGTFSKSRAMAGARIGFAIASEELIAAMQNVKFAYNSYTINQPAILAGIEAINDDAYFRQIRDKIVNTREKAKKKLAELGFEGTDSKTNFLFVKHKSVKASEIFEYLKSKDIYVRYWNKPRIDNYLRITIGTDEEMERLYEELEKICR